MSYAPAKLKEARGLLAKQTGLDPIALGIVGSTRHKSGYHLGADRLPPDDYSARHERDRAGLSDAASAFDVGWFERIVELTGWLVAEAQAGRIPDLREVIGPTIHGHANRWDDLAGWVPQRRADGDDHEWHLHTSWYRDSERRDKVGTFRRFFDKHVPISNQPPMPNWTEKAVRRLPVLRKGAKGAEVRTLQGLLIARGSGDSKVDGQFGGLTERAVKREQNQANIAVDGIVGPATWPKLLGV